MFINLTKNINILTKPLAGFPFLCIYHDMTKFTVNLVNDTVWAVTIYAKMCGGEFSAVWVRTVSNFSTSRNIATDRIRQSMCVKTLVRISLLLLNI